MLYSYEKNNNKKQVSKECFMTFEYVYIFFSLEKNKALQYSMQANFIFRCLSI